jgi:uncharacterized protein (DUF983 family)
MVPDRVSVPAKLWRGIRKRCPRCGGGKLFKSWYQMKPRCPSCGVKFERESGFFLGAYVINYGITGLCLAAVMAALIVRLAMDPQGSIVPFLVAGAAVAVIVPLASYPFGKTGWAAIDLVMRPLDAAEEAEALLAQEDQDRRDG